jgi:hypothetical protein
MIAGKGRGQGDDFPQFIYGRPSGSRLSRYMKISNKDLPAVIPSELRSEKQHVSYPGKVSSVNQALLLTTKVLSE